MRCEYALFTLKQKKSFLEDKLTELDTGNHKDIHGETSIERFKAKLKHDIGELNYGIEILEEYIDQQD